MIRLVQVSDPHVGPRPDYRLAGVDTRRSFGEVMSQVQQEQADVLLMTGDNAADHSEEAYRHFFSVLAEVSQPWYWLPGNHDLVESAEQAPGGKDFQQVIDLGTWRIIFLDSVIPRSPNGRLGEDQLAVLEGALASAQGRHVLVFLHHHPVNINCAWLDTQRVADADQFFEILDRYNSVRGVFWGHIHQEFNAERKGVKLHSCPSTCIQFLPNSDDFALDTESPGYRVIDLADDGTFTTYVRRVEIPDLAPDMNCHGYE